LVCEDFWGSCKSLPTSLIRLQLTTKSSMAAHDLCLHLTRLHTLEWHRQQQRVSKPASLASNMVTLITSPQSLAWFQLHYVQKIILYPNAYPLVYTVSAVFPLQAPNLQQFGCFFEAGWDDLHCWIGMQTTNHSQNHEAREMLVCFPFISNIQRLPMISYRCVLCTHKTKPCAMNQSGKIQHCPVCQKAMCSACTTTSNSLLCKICRRRQRFSRT
jgi:hypothetical protein